MKELNVDGVQSIYVETSVWKYQNYVDVGMTSSNLMMLMTLVAAIKGNVLEMNILEMYIALMD